MTVNAILEHLQFGDHMCAAVDTVGEYHAMAAAFTKGDCVPGRRSRSLPLIRRDCVGTYAPRLRVRGGR